MDVIGFTPGRQHCSDLDDRLALGQAAVAVHCGKFVMKLWHFWAAAPHTQHLLQTWPKVF
jgi:hypothetical protein